MKPGRKRDNDVEALVQAYTPAQADPERVGCPTFEMLEAFLRGQLNRDQAEGLYEHLPHCRECLLELRTLRDIRREEGKTEDAE